MSDPFLSFGGGPQSGGASEPTAEEPPAWTLARWQLPRHGYQRGEVVTVNMNEPGVKYEVTSGWLVPLDAWEQPRIVTDPLTMEPTIKEENMTVVNKGQRKEVTIGFTVEGDEAEVEAGTPLETKKTVKNTGETDLFFPADFTGSCELTVQGSKPDSAADTGTISVT